MNDVELEIDDDHPLALELSSLRTAVAQFQVSVQLLYIVQTTQSHSQHEAHTSALKLQRHSLEATISIERAQALEHENAATRVELAALRAHPDSTPHPAELQLPELTLALRRASDKLTLAENALHERTAQFVDMQGAASRAHYAADNAFGVAASARAREEEALVRERGLMLQLRMAEEEGRMMDRAVREYADLVRALERRQSLPSSLPPPSSPPPPTPPPKQSPPPDGAHTSNGKPPEQDRNGRSAFESLQERREGLHMLAGKFEGTNKALSDEIARLQVELDGARSELEAGRKAAEEERLRLSRALAELERIEHDDNAAAKMVSRYMYVQFSPTPSPAKDTPSSTGSSPKPQQIRYKERSSPSMRATQQRYPRCIRSSLLRRPHSPMSSASQRACAMSWTRQQSNSLGRPMDVGARSRCGSQSLGGRTNLPRRFVDGCVARRRRAQRRTYLSRSGSTLSFETRASCLALLMVRLLVGI
jgi:hypothetical protein